MSLPFEDGPEARLWLLCNEEPFALASNRFGPTSEALEFVEQLYAAGVLKVFVPSDSILELTDSEGGFYADTLIAEVGPDTDRATLLDIYGAECEHEGHEHPYHLPLYEDRYLLFWWD